METNLSRPDFRPQSRQQNTRKEEIDLEEEEQRNQLQNQFRRLSINDQSYLIAKLKNEKIYQKLKNWDFNWDFKENGTTQDEYQFKSQLEQVNQWTQNETQQIIDEYLKFIYLLIIFPDQHLSPPDKIDKVWHYHILNTTNYTNLCNKFNDSKYIHHNPARDAEEQRRNLNENYKLTKEKYIETFSQIPPSTIFTEVRKGIDMQNFNIVPQLNSIGRKIFQGITYLFKKIVWLLTTNPEQIKLENRMIC